MTITQIQAQLAEHRVLSRQQLYAYFKACEIRPIGCRQRPQNYPNDSADRILAHLGFKVVSMPQLREARRRAKKGGRR